MTYLSNSAVNQGDLSGCLCYPSPSCALFPRRPDGKVTLPNPLYLAKDGQTTTTHQQNIEENDTTRRRRASSLVEIERSTHSDYHQVISLDACAPTPPPVRATMKHIDNYAQLSSLPEFRAFKLNQNGRLETRRRAQTDSILETTGKQEWMEEIRVSRRTKKQAYVRSGTHDFSIRLYSLDNKKKKNRE